jgi:hypothetical protein
MVEKIRQAAPAEIKRRRSHKAVVIPVGSSFKGENWRAKDTATNEISKKMKKREKRVAMSRSSFPFSTAVFELKTIALF